jgi:hypothetical protein
MRADIHPLRDELILAAQVEDDLSAGKRRTVGHRSSDQQRPKERQTGY